MLLDTIQEDANCIITMAYIIKLVLIYSRFEPLQLCIKRILVAVREMNRNCGQIEDFEVMFLTFFRVVMAVRNNCCLYSKSAY